VGVRVGAGVGTTVELSEGFGGIAHPADVAVAQSAGRGVGVGRGVGAGVGAGVGVGRGVGAGVGAGVSLGIGAFLTICQSFFFPTCAQMSCWPFTVVF